MRRIARRLTPKIFKGVYAFPLGRRYVKLFLPWAARKRTSELAGNTAACQDVRWATYVVRLDPFGRSIFCMPRGMTPVPSCCERLALDIAEAALEERRFAPACELLDLTVLRMTSLSDADIARVSNVLESFTLPAGSSHGDLHFGNFVEIGGRLMIIDWAMYRGRSSPVFDYLHYHCRLMCKLNSASWTTVVWADIPAWQVLCSKYGLYLERLRVAYVIDRLARELSQKESCGEIASPKYQALLTKLVKVCQGLADVR